MSDRPASEGDVTPELPPLELMTETMRRGAVNYAKEIIAGCAISGDGIGRGNLAWWATIVATYEATLRELESARISETPDTEPDYDALFARFQERIAYWPPEWTQSRDHFAEIFDLLSESTTWHPQTRSLRQ